MANKKYNRKTNEERLQEIKQLSDGALDRIKEYTSSAESLKEYADFMANFYQYSARNNTLIQDQFEGAKAVASFKDWSDKGFIINKGEKGIKILSYTPITKFNDKNGQEKQLRYATKEEKEQIKKGTIKTNKTAAFSIGHVYDVSQTNAKASDLPTIFPNRIYDFKLDEGNNVKHLKSGIDSLADKLDINIQDMKDSKLGFNELGVARGAFIQSLNDPNKKEVLLNNRNSETQNLAVSIHELAHLRLHQKGTEGFKYDTPTKEFQAELTSYIVCKHYGIDTSDFTIPYIAKWTDNGEKVEDKQRVLENVHSVSKEFMETIDKTIVTEREREINNFDLNYENQLITIQNNNGLTSKNVELENLNFGDDLRRNNPEEFNKYLTYSVLYQYEQGDPKNSINEPMMYIHGVSDRLEQFGKVNNFDLTPYKYAETQYTMVVPNSSGKLQAFTSDYETSQYAHPLHHMQKENLLSSKSLKELENSWHDYLIESEERDTNTNLINSNPIGYLEESNMDNTNKNERNKSFGDEFYDVGGRTLKHIEGTENIVIGKYEWGKDGHEFKQLSEEKLNILDYKREYDERIANNQPTHGFADQRISYTSQGLNGFKDDLIDKGFSKDQAESKVLDEFKTVGLMNSEKYLQMEKRIEKTKSPLENSQSGVQKQNRREFMQQQMRNGLDR